MDAATRDYWVLRSLERRSFCTPAYSGDNPKRIAWCAGDSLRLWYIIANYNTLRGKGLHFDG